MPKHLSCRVFSACYGSVGAQPVACKYAALAKSFSSIKCSRTLVSDTETPELKDHMSWLTRARWDADNSEDLLIQPNSNPDGQNFAETPQDVIDMLRFDSKELDFDAVAGALA